MRILIVNDDGITAPGLVLAEEIGAEIAGPDGEVWTVAPENERSGASHAISYTIPTRLNQLSERRFAIDGFPADCAIAGIQRVMAEAKPDLVLSGVNRGHNVAEDTVYSGTVGAAMEACLQGVPSIALSQFFRRGDDAPDDFWGTTRAFGAAAVRTVLSMETPADVFWNVNFPAVNPGACKGNALCPQGIRAEGTFSIAPHTAPNGRDYNFMQHRIANGSAPEGSDARMLIEGWITFTPLRPQLTAWDVLERARAALG